jgi:hypothetical protein
MRRLPRSLRWPCIGVLVDPTARTATVTGLVNGTAYSFTVTATNPDGTSQPSDPSAPITPGPPVATTLTLTVARPVSCTVAPLPSPAGSSKPTPRVSPVRR